MEFRSESNGLEGSGRDEERCMGWSTAVDRSTASNHGNDFRTTWRSVIPLLLFTHLQVSPNNG
ncbi:hypothetical protein Csa_019287 [Cucumis sativus]|uniref:Uncharacterized protein n=1 Tax=Cucumis sativus TaxID=3659 RepID=A0A0A0LF38_CUCSA|nr:hypothetical protein Csa_019287 [Cucumis sativus]